MDILQNPLFQNGVGYAASLVILVSLVTTNVFRLRLINGIGSVVFGWYGWLLGSWPVCAINWIIAAIDLWYLVRHLTATAYFELEPADRIGAPYLRKFFLYHERDIHRFTPDVTLDALASAETYVLIRNLLPVGLFAFRRDPSSPEATIVADYTIPQYRDFKAGRFLYHYKRLFFKEQGIKSFSAPAASPAQARYYRKNGFLPASPDTFRLDL